LYVIECKTGSSGQEYECKYRMAGMDDLRLDNADSAVFAHYLRN